jgi:predicted nuclease of predicted toxin-antitoxin system
MPRTIRFHLDEHCPHAIAEGPRRHRIDVTTSTDAGLLRASDKAYVAFCMAEGRVIFTEDNDYLELRARGASHFGITCCRASTRKAAGPRLSLTAGGPDSASFEMLEDLWLSRTSRSDAILSRGNDGQDCELGLRRHGAPERFGDRRAGLTMDATSRLHKEFGLTNAYEAISRTRPADATTLQ